MKNTKLSALQIGIIVLILATAIIHLMLGRSLFILNGLGYLGLLAALFLPIPFLLPYRKSVHWVLMGYVALTIVLYFVFRGSQAFSNPLGLIDKTIEIILLVFLWLQRRA